MLASAVSRLADLLEEKTQVTEIAYNDLLGVRTQTQVPEVAYNVVVNEATRFDANVDSGTSVSASGRRCLFPTELITKWHPETSVRSASQQRMDVLFVGTMILHRGASSGALPARRWHYARGLRSARRGRTRVRHP